MLYEDFKRMLVADLKEEFGDYKVEETIVAKSNENELEGIIVRIDDNIGPCMYVKHIYEDMVDNDRDYEEVLTGVISTFRHSMNRAPKMDKLKSTILVWENARTLLRARPILKVSNEEFLRDKPYKEYLDFPIIYFLDLGDGSVVHISNSLVNHWEIDNNILHGVAMTNMEHLRYTIRDIGNEFDITQIGSRFLYLTNDSVFGSNSIFSKNALKECATTLRTDRIVIIPTSIHEVLILSREEADCKALKKTLNAMNCTIDVNEVLSDHLYFYDNTTGEITL